MLDIIAYNVLLYNIRIIENNILILESEKALKNDDDLSLYAEIEKAYEKDKYKQDIDIDEEPNLENDLYCEKRKSNKVNEVIFVFLRFFFILFKFILFVVFLYYPFKVINFIKLNYRNLIFTIYFLFIFLFALCFNIKHVFKFLIYLFVKNSTYRVCCKGHCSDLTIYLHHYNYVNYEEGRNYIVNFYFLLMAFVCYKVAQHKFGREQ